LTREGDTGVKEGTIEGTILKGGLGGIGVEGIGEWEDGGAGLNGCNLKKGGLNFDLIFGGGLNERFEIKQPSAVRAGGTGASPSLRSSPGCCLASL